MIELRARIAESIAATGRSIKEARVLVDQAQALRAGGQRVWEVDRSKAEAPRQRGRGSRRMRKP